MTDYYTKFQPKAESRCKELYKIFSDLKAQLPKVRKRLEDEKQNRDNLQNRLAKLKEISVESLAGDASSYEKYKVSMRKLQNELQIIEEIIENVTNKILPSAESRLRDAETNLKIILNQMVILCRKDADAEINQLLRDCITEYESFLSAFEQIFQDYGQSFICSDESYCPGPWLAQEIGNMKIRLGMIPNPEPSYEKVWVNYNKNPAEPEKPKPEPLAEADTSDNLNTDGLKKDMDGHVVTVGQGEVRR